MTLERDETQAKLHIGCPHCGKRFSAKPEAMGRSGPCPACRERFTITEAVLVRAAEVQGPSGTQAEPARPPRAPSEPTATAAIPSPPQPPAAAAPVASGQYRVGDRVLVKGAKDALWLPARVSECVGNKLLLTTFSGVQVQRSANKVKGLGVVPGGAVVYLDEQRGAYVPGAAHAVTQGAVLVEEVGGELKWYPQRVVFPDTVEVGAAIVKRGNGGALTEIGRVGIISPGTGIRFGADGPGFERTWQADEIGKGIGYAPESVAPNAPRQMPHPSDAQERQQGWVLAGLLGLMFLPLALTSLPWVVRLVGTLIGIGVYIGVGGVLMKQVSPLLKQRVCQRPSWWVIGALCVLAIFVRQGAAKLSAPIWYGAAMAVAVVGVFGLEEMKKHEPTFSEEAAATPEPPGFLMGERVLCIPPENRFCLIGRVVAQSAGQWEVELAGGRRVRPDPRRVLPYEVRVMHTVLARRGGQGAFLPGVIVHLKDAGFTVRYDDFSTAEVGLGEVWFYLHPILEATMQASQEELDLMEVAVEDAKGEAQAACERGDTKRAHYVLSNAIRAYPQMPAFHLYRAYVYQVEGNHERTAAEARAAIGELSHDPVPYTVLGNAYLKVNENVRAEAAFRRALNLAPQEAGHWQNVGNVLLRLGKQADAERFFEEARRRGFVEGGSA